MRLAEAMVRKLPEDVQVEYQVLMEKAFVAAYENHFNRKYDDWKDPLFELDKYLNAMKPYSSEAECLENMTLRNEMAPTNRKEAKMSNENKVGPVISVEKAMLETFARVIRGRNWRDGPVISRKIGMGKHIDAFEKEFIDYMEVLMKHDEATLLPRKTVERKIDALRANIVFTNGFIETVPDFLQGTIENIQNQGFQAILKRHGLPLDPTMISSRTSVGALEYFLCLDFEIIQSFFPVDKVDLKLKIVEALLRRLPIGARENVIGKMAKEIRELAESGDKGKYKAEEIPERVFVPKTLEQAKADFKRNSDNFQSFLSANPEVLQNLIRPITREDLNGGYVAVSINDLMNRHQQNRSK